MKKSIFLITMVVIIPLISSCVTVKPVVAPVDKEVEQKKVSEAVSIKKQNKIDIERWSLDSYFSYLEKAKNNEETIKRTVLLINYLFKNQVMNAGELRKRYQISLFKAVEKSQGMINPDMILEFSLLDIEDIRAITQTTISCSSLEEVLLTMEYSIKYRTVFGYPNNEINTLSEILSKLEDIKTLGKCVISKKNKAVKNNTLLGKTSIFNKL